MLLTFLMQLYSIKVERTLLFVLVEYYKERLIIITQIIIKQALSLPDRRIILPTKLESFLDQKERT